MNAAEPLTPAAQPDADDWFVEQMGLLAEADGLPRIAGRVFAYLLLADTPRSLDELAGALAVSKASVSTDARLLLERRLIERTCRSGDRRDYYQVAPDFLRRIVEYRVSRWAALRDAVASFRARADVGSPIVAERLERVEAAHALLIERLMSAVSAPDDTRPATGVAR